MCAYKNKQLITYYYYYHVIYLFIVVFALFSLFVHSLPGRHRRRCKTRSFLPSPWLSVSISDLLSISLCHSCSLCCESNTHFDIIKCIRVNIGNDDAQSIYVCSSVYIRYMLWRARDQARERKRSNSEPANKRSNERMCL